MRRPDVDSEGGGVVFADATPARSGPPPFEEAYPALFRDAYRVAYRLLGDRSEAEDVAQEACARAYSRWSSVHDHAAPWCVRVSSNLALDRLRAVARAAQRNDRLAGAASRTSGHGIDDRLDLQAALGALPRRQRQVVVLRYIGDLSEAQTAQALGTSVGSVKTHASRGLSRLREVMGR